MTELEESDAPRSVSRVSRVPAFHGGLTPAAVPMELEGLGGGGGRGDRARSLTAEEMYDCRGGGMLGVLDASVPGTLEYLRCCFSTVAGEETVRGMEGALLVGVA